MPSLPVELIDKILGYCDTGTLLTATQATPIAERRLYRFVHLNSTQRCDALITAITASPSRRRGELVQGMRVFHKYMDRPDYMALLVLLPNLKRFNLTVYSRGIHLPEDGFPFRLRRLRLMDTLDRLMVEPFLAFLEQQHGELEVLEILESKTGRRSEAVCARARDRRRPPLLPQLRSVLASVDVVVALLERPTSLLQHITLPKWDPHSCGSPTEAEPAPVLCAAISSSGADIRSLTLGTHDVARALCLVAAACPSLHKLDLIIDHADYNQFIELLKSSQIALPPFPSLRHLTFTINGQPTAAPVSHSHLLAPEFCSIVRAGVCGVIKNLPVDAFDIQLRRRSPVMKLTFYFPRQVMVGPSAEVPDWHPFHEEFDDRDFFCCH